MSLKITRRELAAAVVGSAAALGQSGTPQDELAAAVEQLRISTDALDKSPLPMAVEPALRFEA